MDPDAALAELRELARTFLRLADSMPDDLITDRPSPGGSADAPVLDLADAARCAELIQALDGWMCARGYLPSSWAAGRAAR